MGKKVAGYIIMDIVFVFSLICAAFSILFLYTAIQGYTPTGTAGEQIANIFALGIFGVLFLLGIFATGVSSLVSFLIAIPVIRSESKFVRISAIVILIVSILLLVASCVHLFGCFTNPSGVLGWYI